VLVVDSATRDFVGLTGPVRDRINQLPGLDGLRALAVVAVLAFHAGFDRMVGGYLGVSTFFTLSGFLITTLLIHESRRSGRVDLRSFWSRRFRRLWPAALLVLAAVALLFAPFVATAAQQASMRGDLLSSLFEVANWHFVFSGDSYGQLFVSPSPVLHFWSLAIEEQFYLLFPLVLLGLWRWSRGRPGRLAAGLATLTVCSVLEPFLFDMSDDRVYFGTDTRAAELLLGALLAVLLSSDRVRLGMVARPRLRSGLALAGLAAFAVQVWWWWSLPQDTAWLYRGGFAGYALLSCVVIAAVASPSGPMSALCGLWALRWLGVRSYAVYLVHWPIYLTVWQLWPELDRVVATAIAVVTSVVLAAVSFRLVEHPIRSGSWPPVGRSAPVAVAATAAVALVAFLTVPSEPAADALDFESTLAQFESLGTEPPPPVPTPAPPAVTEPPGTAPPVVPVPRVAVFGDSTGLTAGMGYFSWAEPAGRATFVTGQVELGCGVSRFESSRSDTTMRPASECPQWERSWAERITAGRPDVAMLFTSVWEVPDAVLPDGSAGSIGDAGVDEFIRSEFRTALDVLSEQGALVLVVTTPPYGSWADDGRNEFVERQYDPERTDRLNALLRGVAAERPESVRVLDLAAGMAGRTEDRSLRPDGVHYDIPAFGSFSEEWFGPELERIWTEWWTERSARP
jgi:peptidoglycan/LPS O-acetylase OafA/YrhL